MSKLRKSAQGQECMIRIPNVCNGNPETVVLCHIRRGNVAGMGQKPNDLCAVYGCSDCHDAVDRRNNMGGYTPVELDTYILEALCRQLSYWVKNGFVKI